MKTLGLILATGLFAFSATAQTQDTRDQLKFGLKAGANLANVWDENDQDFQADHKLGFAGGAYLSIPLGTFIGIQPNVIYSQKGYQSDGRFLGQSYTVTRTSNFLDVPILFELKPSPFVTIVAGPQYSYLMSQEDKVISDNFSASEYEEFENDNIRKNTMGFLVGMDIHANQFVISPRAGWDFQHNKGDGTSEDPRYKNQWVQLTVGFEF